MIEEDNEQVVKPDRIGSMDPEVLAWKPPSNEHRQTMLRVWEIQKWIERKGFVTEEEAVQYALRRWRPITRPTAKGYVKKVIKEFRAKGIPVMRND